MSTDAFSSRMSRRPGAWTAPGRGLALSMPAFADGQDVVCGISLKEVASTV